MNLLGFSEEGGEIVEVLLRPVVEGMVVALRAANAHTHKDLRGGGREFHRCGVVTENVSHSRIGIGATGGTDKFTDHFVVGFFLINGTVNVGEELVSSGDIRANAQHVGHENGPTVGKAGVIGKFIDELDPAVGSPFLEFPHFFHGGYAADEVDGGTSKEGGIGDGPGGDNAGVGIFSLQEIIEHLGCFEIGFRSLCWHRDAFGFGWLALGQGDALGPLSTGFHPLIEQNEIFVFQHLPFVGHYSFIDWAKMDSDEYLAFFRIARNDGVGGISAFHDFFVGVHAESAFDFRLGVTANAMAL